MQKEPEAPFYIDPSDDSGETRWKPPTWRTLVHVLWLRRWLILGVAALCAIPTGIVLTLVDLPRSFQSATVMRFPAVVGAQTNMMRDVAITRQASIIAIFNSYSLLERTVDALSLRMRLATPDIFRKHAIEKLEYQEKLGEGLYEVRMSRGRHASLRYTPSTGGDTYSLFDGVLPESNAITIPGLRLVLTEGFVRGAEGLDIRLRFQSKDKVIETLKESLRVRPLGEDNFEISLQDRDPWLVSDILNHLREEFLNVYYGTTQVQDMSVLAQMEADLESAKKKLERSQDELDIFYRKNPVLLTQNEGAPDNTVLLVDLRNKKSMVEERRIRLQRIMTARPTDMGGQEGRIWAEQITQALSEAGDPRGGILGATLRGLREKDEQLRPDLGPEHPRLKEMREEQEKLLRDIEQAYHTQLEKMQQEAASLENQLAGVRSGSQRQQASVKVQLELERLSVSNRNNQAIYDNILTAYNRAKLSTGSEFFKVTVVDPARPARYEPPSLLGRLVVAAAGSAIWFLLIPGGVALWQVAFLKIWTREDVRRYLGIKVVGTVSFKPLDSLPPASTKESGEMGPVDPLLLYYGRGHRLEDIETFRLIREELENIFVKYSANGKLCLMVTSTQPHDGKSICASNLAVAFARKGRKTLLIDGDLRLGRLHKIFGLNPTSGFEELLARTDLKENEFLQEATALLKKTVQSNLILMPRRKAALNAGELIASPRYAAFVRMARSQSDVVIIDTPPVLITPEPLPLAKQADGILFVLRSGVTSVAESRDALATLREHNPRIVSLVNQAKTSPFHSNRYLKYAYYYNAQMQAENDRVVSENSPR